VRMFVIYLCRACGWIQGAEERDLRCARCGEAREQIEEIRVVEVHETV
jgi:rubredoxin